MEFADLFGHAHPPMPSESDPTKYPRNVEIEDDALITAIMTADAKLEELNRLAQQVHELQESMQILTSERQIILTKFWRSCRETYPTLHEPHDDGERGMVGYRKFDGRFFYVGWPMSWQGEQQKS